MEGRPSGRPWPNTPPRRTRPGQQRSPEVGRNRTAERTFWFRMSRSDRGSCPSLGLGQNEIVVSGSRIGGRKAGDADQRRSSNTEATVKGLGRRPARAIGEGRQPLDQPKDRQARPTWLRSTPRSNGLRAPARRHQGLRRGWVRRAWGSKNLASQTANGQRREPRDHIGPGSRSIHVGDRPILRFGAHGRGWSATTIGGRSNGIASQISEFGRTTNPNATGAEDRRVSIEGGGAAAGASEGRDQTTPRSNSEPCKTATAQPPLASGQDAWTPNGRRAGRATNHPASWKEFQAA